MTDARSPLWWNREQHFFMEPGRNRALPEQNWEYSPILLCTSLPDPLSFSAMELKNPETEVVQHQEIYSGKIVRVNVDRVRLAPGIEVIREVVIHPGGVAAVPLLGDGRVVLIRQFRYPLQKFILELPAGKLDMGKTPAETIAAELIEETGYQAGRLDYGFSFYTTPGISNEVIHLYLARDLSPVPRQVQEGEHITVEPHTLEDCLQMIESGEISDGKTILGILWYKNRPKTS
jgi:ADP-ribose pyrophosphatase